MGILSEIKAYAGIIKDMTPAQVLDILGSYGNAAIIEFNGFPDEGKNVITKAIYLKRKAACKSCPLKSNGVCRKTLTRAHVSKKNADGSPVWVNGCGCGLWAKQKDISKHCPAGEW